IFFLEQHMMKKLTVKLILSLFTILFILTLVSAILLRVLMIDNSVPMTRDKVFFLIIIVAFLILIFFGIATEYILIRRLKRLTEATKIIAKGNFDFDITDNADDELSELATNFNLMLKTLRANEYLSKDFINSVSHEFKTPITSLKGYAKLLQKDTVTAEERKEYSEIILSESERLHKLATDLLRLSALESSDIIKQSAEFRLDEQIKQIILLLQKDWENKNLDMVIDLDPVKYKGNEELIYLVWLNLISNAIKYTDSGGKIEIGLNADKTISFKIKDNGIGIKNEYKDKIFDQFFMADKSRNNNSSGLGLAITKKIVEKFGGNISFVSRVGEGTEFTVILPRL
ncbi:MAG: HAMP domain-containing histidine kinase, partial [Clostridiales bacterium]|nr:HAMP domain-containing histidine kinase [Clostridiales bacterium]